LCFPGYDNRGSDLPPPKICAQTWRNRVLRHVPDLKMTLLIGAHAMDWHLGRGTNVRERVANWRALWPSVVPLPHPSWRNTAWLKRNPWFEAEVVPALRARVQEILK
ncbi:MAG: uracil-DNA glycosylase family protein, partial [Pseudomonadota bacterium]